MNTAQDILSYAKSHHISMIAEDGKLKIYAPKEVLTDEFLDTAKQHKSEILLFTIISDACEGYAITPQQFINLLDKGDKEDILSGGIQGECLHAYAKSFSQGIKSGRIAFHPTTGLLVKHGLTN